MAGDTQEKNLPATLQRLKKAREKGQVASSPDFVAAAVAVAVAVWLVVRGRAVANRIVGAFAIVADTLPRAADTAIDRRVLESVLYGLTYELAGLVVLAGLAGIGANIIHKGGLVVSVKPLAPDLSRIALGGGLKRLFGLKAAAGFGIAFAWLTLWFACTGLILWRFAGPILNAPLCGFGCLLDAGTDLLRTVALVGLVAIVVAGLLDLPLQIFLFRRDMRMSHQDRKQEMKDMEGSPEIQGQRRELHQRLLKAASGLPTVVLTGGDCAVALRFHAQDLPVPVVVSKGRERHRDRIVAAAHRLGVAVVSDPALARRLMERVQVGVEIPASEFGAVAPHIVRTVAAAPVA